MTAPGVTVAIPVLDAGPGFQATLEAVRWQKLDRPVELLVCDSGSTDGSAQLARRHGAEVFDIPRGSFSHGGTRNLLMERATGAHVAFLTQDAVPAHDRWLAELLSGFALAEDVGLAFGPYLPRPDASHMVARELTEWFASFAPDGRPRLDRLDADERGLPAERFIGPRAFFTDANGCVARAAWEQVPFRTAPYAEDHLLALDMLRAGYAKAFVPSAGVVHSHDYPPGAWFRRCFDEWRGLREVYEHREPAAPRPVAVSLKRQLAGDWRWLGEERELPPVPRAAAMARSLRHYVLRAAGAAAGSRADRLPPRVRRWCSLERRATFEPQPCSVQVAKTATTEVNA